jgi:hypothetical protein
VKLWKVEADEYSWDEYDSFVIRASTAKHAEKLALKASHGKQAWTATPITVAGEEEVILGSWNAR